MYQVFENKQIIKQKRNGRNNLISRRREKTKRKQNKNYAIALTHHVPKADKCLPRPEEKDG